MAGIFDSLGYGNQGGYGGLLDALFYPSPLLKPDEVQQPQYDPMGNYTGITPQASNPFGPPPAFDPRQFAPQSVFNGNMASSAVPYSAPMQSQVPALPPAQTVAPAPQPAPPQNRPTTTLDVGGYQMPQFGSPPPQTAQAPSTDLSAQSRQAPQELPPALGGGQSGFGGALRGFANNLHTGPIGALVGAIGNGMGVMSPEQQNLRATYEATRAVLKQSGMGEQEASSKAMLAVLNPEAGKTILPEALTTKEKFHTLKDSFGNETPAFINERDQTVNGKPVGQGGSSGVDGSGGVSQLSDKITTMRAQGATQQQLLNEVPAMYRGYVKSLLAGDALPQNIGRSQARGALMTLAHAVDDHFDESLIPQRMTYARGIGDTKSTTAPGGQRQAINTATGHFADLAEALVAQKNVNGGALSALPGSGPLATGYNAIANSSSKNSENSAKILQEADSTAGEMGKLYSGSQGGGVHEREATKSRYSPNLPPLQAAGALQATRDLLLEKIRANESARDQAFGPGAKERIDFMDDSVKRNLARVDAAIAKLKGETSLSSGNQTKTGVSWSVVK